MNYVLVLCRKKVHYLTKDLVLLVLKNRPQWQKNRFNLVGGKIEEGESSVEAAIREVREETGLEIQDVVEMGQMIDGESTIHCMMVDENIRDDDLKPRPGETEKVVWAGWSEAMNDPRLIPNLRLIVPLMLSNAAGWVIRDSYRSSDENFHDIKISVPTMLGENNIIDTAE